MPDVTLLCAFGLGVAVGVFGAAFAYWWIVLRHIVGPRQFIAHIGRAMYYNRWHAEHPIDEDGSR